MQTACKICGNTADNRFHAAREMFLGLRHPFTYLECGNCGCVQLTSIPQDLSQYYPANYYSFSEHGTFKTFLRHQWSAYAFGAKNPLGWFLTKSMFPNLAIEVVRRSGVPKTARILDVGCGSGRTLLDLAYLGFTDLTGADPFVERDLVYSKTVKVLKRELANVCGTFDLITFHYSFEHMDEPEVVLRQTKRLLAAGGQVIIRIPVASSYAWRRYGTNWFNLDPPRHLYIHTFRSMELLCARTGLRITETVQEGGGGQFWTSEEYEQNIPHNDPRTLGSSLIKRLSNWKKIRCWNRQAQELNRKGEGDLVGFHLRHG